MEWISAGANLIPLGLKIAYSVFMLILVPIYLRSYGPSNFLYFCDVALLLILVGVWIESPLLISIAAVGILIPQSFWLFDFLANIAGWRISGMTDYMLDPRRPLLLRGLSLFHGWLPLLLLYLVQRTGYDGRALPIWIGLASALVLVCYFLMPPPSPSAGRGLRPVNINYVYGFSDEAPQSWMPSWAWLLVVLIGFPLLLYWPAHLLLSQLMPPPVG